CEGEAPQPLVEARDADRRRRVRRGLPRPRAERLVLRTLRLPAPPRRLDADRRGALPARARLSTALGRLQCCMGAVRDRARRDALLGPRPGTRLRPPVAARRSAAPVRRLVLLG